MGKATAQGTRWESQIVKDLHDVGLSARRTAKAGQKGEADVVGNKFGGTNFPRTFTVHVVAWKRLTSNAGGKRRSKMGEGKVAVIPWDQFVELSRASSRDLDIIIQAKATQALSVTVVLKELRDWWKNHGN